MSFMKYLVDALQRASAKWRDDAADASSALDDLVRALERLDETIAANELQETLASVYAGVWDQYADKGVERELFVYEARELADLPCAVFRTVVRGVRIEVWYVLQSQPQWGYSFVAKDGVYGVSLAELPLYGSLAAEVEGVLVPVHPGAIIRAVVGDRKVYWNGKVSWS
ncbi:hypothetical protein D6833_10095 [Candidatus Parcubacteria bacterium]|nr:MAG: hypothetical protein D6833_10095 [Candidatus Parcubacteria bacterium]